jgi:hypothetical protein
MKSPLLPPLGLTLVACASLGLGLGALRADDTKKNAPAAAPAKPAAAPRAAAAPVKPLVQRPAQPQQAAKQLRTIDSNTKSLGAKRAGDIGFDGRKAPAGAVKANTPAIRKTPEQISKEQSVIPNAQPKKLKKLAPPPSP